MEMFGDRTGAQCDENEADFPGLTLPAELIWQKLYLADAVGPGLLRN